MPRRTIADALSSSFTTLRDGLSSRGGMAGTDPGGIQWGSTYDNAVVEITGVTKDVINGLCRLAGLLKMTGFKSRPGELGLHTGRHGPDDRHDELRPRGLPDRAAVGLWRVGISSGRVGPDLPSRRLRLA
ncbi:MAG: hypothetical protein ACRDR6_00675 [Pseudonocardiaceae bacterium]